MRWKDVPTNIRVRLITSFLNRIVSSAVMPFMALLFAQHINKVFAGTFLLMTVIIGFFTNLIGGYISDRFSRIKILIATSSLSSAAFLLMTLSLIAITHLIWLFACAYLSFIITSSLGRPSMNAIIIDSTTSENRKAVYTIDYWLVNLSMAMGVSLGGLLYSDHKLLLFSFLCVTSASLPIAYKIWLKDARTIRVSTKKRLKIFADLAANYRVALKDRRFVNVMIGTAFIFSAEFSLNSYAGIRLQESFHAFHIGTFTVSGVRMLSALNIENMLLVVCLTFFVNKLADRFSGKKALLMGLLCYGIGYSVVMSANIWYVLILFNLLATIGELIYSPLLNAETASMMPADKRGSYSAFSNLSFNGGNLLARSTIIIGAYLAPLVISFYIGLSVLLGALFVYGGLYVTRRTKVQQEKRKATQR